MSLPLPTLGMDKWVDWTDPAKIKLTELGLRNMRTWRMLNEIEYGEGGYKFGPQEPTHFRK